MNIQIFGRNKSFDTKKAMRFFKERAIPFQYIDIDEKGLSKGELTKIVAALGGLDNVVDPKTRAVDVYHLYLHLPDEDRFQKVVDTSRLLLAPIVRDGNRATVGFKPDRWLEWINQAT